MQHKRLRNFFALLTVFPGPVSLSTRTGMLGSWTVFAIALMCWQCHWSCVCVLHVMLGLWPAATWHYALGSPSQGPRFGDPWKQPWNKEKTNWRAVVTFLLEYYQLVQIVTKREIWGFVFFILAIFYLPANKFYSNNAERDFSWTTGRN